MCVAMDRLTQVGNRKGTERVATAWFMFQRNDAAAPRLFSQRAFKLYFVRKVLMKKFLALAVAAGALAIAAPASAQSWQNINQRQANLDQRIDAGVRTGDLTRGEAVRLRAEFNDLARLEARYRSSNGLSYAERADLDRRFDALSARVRFERNDRQDRNDRWVPINQRQRQLDQRIDAGIRDRSLSRQEAYALRAEFQQIVRLEATYRRNGLDARERNTLDRRMDRLGAMIQAERSDRNNRFG